jgi:hypothetical protein
MRSMIGCDVIKLVLYINTGVLMLESPDGGLGTGVPLFVMPIAAVEESELEKRLTWGACIVPFWDNRAIRVFAAL